ncbi:MAG: type II secretion system protein GspL [Deltaproteobacteria bacterium]|nr:type II secretion system protein GspL [Deltaproteobacteria bacterium]
MARPLLVIEFSHGSVRAGVFSGPGAPPYYLSLPLTLPMTASGLKDAAASALAALREGAKADPGACSVFVCLPPSSVSMRVISVPMDKREKINEVLPFELSGVLSVDVGDVVMDNIPLGGGRAIGVAIEKKTLAEYIDAFNALGADPAWIGVAGFSMPRFLHEIHPGPGTKAFISGEFISVSREARPLFFNAYSGRAGLKLSLSYLEAEDIRIDEAYCCALSRPGMERLLPGVPVTDLTLPDSLPPEAAGMAALAFAVKKGFAGETINLRKGEFEYTKEKAAIRKKLRLTFALVLVIAGLLLGKAYLRYMTLNSDLAAYKNALRAAYSELFPGEKAQVDELYHLSAKLKTIEKEAALVKGRPGVLDLMSSLAAAGKDPAMRIKVTELSIADGRLKATGEAASFDAANRFKELLTQDRLFKSVQLSDLKSQAGSTAVFSLLISVI